LAALDLESRRLQTKFEKSLRHGIREETSKFSMTLISDVSKFTGLLKSDPWYVWSAALGAATYGLWSEKTKVGATLSAPLVTMGATILLCNIGLLPTHHAVYDIINKKLVPLAVPLLLFDANIKMVLSSTGSMMACFLLGSLGTILGTIVGGRLVPMGLGLDSWKIAAALCARHIGGAVNYIAVSETVQMGPNAITAGLAADNLVIALYFAFIFWLANKDPGTPKGVADAEEENGQGFKANSAAQSIGDFTILNVMKSLSTACVLCLISSLLQKLYYPSLSIIPIVSVLTVVAASFLPVIFRPIAPSGSKMGVFLMQLFFAATGANGNIAKVAETAPMVFVFSVVQVFVHFLFLMGSGKILKLPLRKLLLSSNANIGGPTSAAAMASAKDWHNLVPPSLLVGIFGYAIATFIGLAMKGCLIRLCPV